MKKYIKPATIVAQCESEDILSMSEIKGEYDGSLPLNADERLDLNSDIELW